MKNLKIMLLFVFILSIGLLITVGCTAKTTDESNNNSDNVNVDKNTTDNNDTANNSDITSLPYLVTWGTVTSIDESTFKLENTGSNAPYSEIVIKVPDNNASVIIDATTGMPSTEIKDNSTAYVYIYPAVAQSMPPQATAYLIITDMPQDYKAPQLITVAEINDEDIENVIITDTNGVNYKVTSDTKLIPYLTKNQPRISTVNVGTELVVWSNFIDAENSDATRLLFMPVQ